MRRADLAMETIRVPIANFLWTTAYLSKSTTVLIQTSWAALETAFQNLAYGGQ